MIHVEGATKWYGDRAILTHVDLVVPRGCLYGLVGPGASGKSVLLKMITGLTRPDAGSVRVDGHEVSAMSEQELGAYRRQVGMLFQNNALFDFMTVFDNIAFPLRRLFDLPETEVARRVQERLDLVNMSAFGHRYPAGLSGGQKKRVGVARATITGAKLLLYDEPAAGLDPVTSQRIFELLRREQRAQDATVLMVSSDLDRLLTVTDRVGMLLDGRLVFDGTTEEALSSTEPHVHQFLHGEIDGPL
jgi:phospholipid/cholesterol/gamma-HCH transport system ATP-binding protein